MQTQSSLNSSDSAAIATAENQGTNKDGFAADGVSTLIGASLEEPSAGTSGSTEMPELYLEINSQHTETLEV